MRKRSNATVSEIAAHWVVTPDTARRSEGRRNAASFGQSGALPLARYLELRGQRLGRAA